MMNYLDEDVIYEREKWPGWPGYNVFRLIVPFTKVGCVIGRKGEMVKKICNVTGARIRVLDAPPNTSDRIVLISAREESDLQFSPAMDALLRIFKRVSGFSSTYINDADSFSSTSTRLLISVTQAMHLVGKQGCTIKSIQEFSGAIVRVLQEDEVPSYVRQDERIVEIHGEFSYILTALESVIEQLRKFLVHHSVIPIFEKMFSASVSQELQNDGASIPDYPFALSDNSLHGREAFDPLLSPSRMPQHSSKLTMQGELRSLPIITQVIQMMQMPISYAEDVIGLNGRNIAYICNTSGASVTVKEIDGLHDEIMVEIKGTSSQVQIAQQLVQDFINGHRQRSPPVYGNVGNGYSTYSHSGEGTYPSIWCSNASDNRPWDWIPWRRRWD